MVCNLVVRSRGICVADVVQLKRTDLFTHFFAPKVEGIICNLGSSLTPNFRKGNTNRYLYIRFQKELDMKHILKIEKYKMER